ncbi:MULTISPECIES: hypothetical protein [Clostridium]|jgi:hypothetical protein|uniref:Uncharacterized protein n=4 Tax=Clostridium TaxID=1485 RepID=A0A0B5QH38_CLOBE|nr:MULTISPECIES: hypothetical protein [Clostridium]ABR32758.1 conserved hypothetical protein [Clostridium beijerinckii NCIMB 8052]AIU00960.1 hypothetical protein Cbs_0571 [Clostridium beijerinckii ATCC 35702]AJG97267.1 hypothetical protein LF65_00632 [Clostridium beijerinckii]ALB48093.1 hypothetical protein X276_23855 [Clostridium beijerinckii NRRL B-598]AQS03189.1 hypothetical protein CLBIJ_05960 [Clostridium beijerinckii]
MRFNDLAKKQYEDIDNLSVLLKNYVDVYRLLIAGASELYGVNLAEKSEVKKALERVENVGELIDKLISTLERCEGSYLKYCKIKNEYITVSTEKDKIFTEIDNELNFQNSEREE